MVHAQAQAYGNLKWYIFNVNTYAWFNKLMCAFIAENITLEINPGKKVGKICRLRIKSPVFKTAKDS